jgi:hypothetical protein
MQENRVMFRRDMDKQRFEHCPKYERHDLSEDQIVEIVKRIRQEDNAELGAFIKQTGKDWIPKIIFFVGAGIYLMAKWLESHGVKIL